MAVGEFVEAIVRVVERAAGVRRADPQPRQPAQRRQHRASWRARWRRRSPGGVPGAPPRALRDGRRPRLLRPGLRRYARARARHRARRARLLDWRRGTSLDRDAAGDRGDYVARYGPRIAQSRSAPQAAAARRRASMSLVVVIPAYNAARHLAGRARAARPLADSAVLAHRRGRRRQHATTTRERVRAARFERTPRSSSSIAPRNGGYGAAMKDGLAARHARRRRRRRLRPRRRPVQPRGTARARSPRCATRAARSAAGLAHRRRARRSRGGMPLLQDRRPTPCSIARESHASGSALTDYHSGYLVYGRARARSCRFRRCRTASTSTSRSSPRARARGLAVGEAPIPTHYGDEISHLEPDHVRAARAAGAVALPARALCGVSAVVRAARCRRRGARWLACATGGRPSFPWRRGAERAGAEHADVGR